MQTGIKLYKIDSKGKTRVWWMEYDNKGYRTHSGIDGGKIVISGWKFPTEKNQGRANATTVEEQVILEVDAEYIKKQSQGKYHAVKDNAKQGAKFIEPMLATKYDHEKNTDFPYYSQPKLDGIRCLISKDGMQSRQGKPIVSCPHIQEALVPFFKQYPDVVLDGELYNHALRDQFEKIVSLVRKTKPTWDDLVETSMLVQYHVYDCIIDDSFKKRLFMINQVGLETIKDCIRVVETNTVDDAHDVETMLCHYLERGFEGQIIRVPEAPYEPKRSKHLLKHKEFEDAEFEIVDIVEGEGNWAGCAKSIMIHLPDGSTQSSGVRGSQEYLAGLLENADEYIGTEVTVRYQNKTADGKLRFPVVTTFWKGKRDV